MRAMAAFAHVAKPPNKTKPRRCVLVDYKVMQMKITYALVNVVGERFTHSGEAIEEFPTTDAARKYVSDIVDRTLADVYGSVYIDRIERNDDGKIVGVEPAGMVR